MSTAEIYDLDRDLYYPYHIFVGNRDLTEQEKLRYGELGGSLLMMTPDQAVDAYTVWRETTSRFGETFSGTILRRAEDSKDLEHTEYFRPFLNYRGVRFNEVNRRIEELTDGLTEEEVDALEIELPEDQSELTPNQLTSLVLSAHIDHPSEEIEFYFTKRGVQAGDLPISKERMEEYRAAGLESDSDWLHELDIAALAKEMRGKYSTMDVAYILRKELTPYQVEVTEALAAERYVPEGDDNDDWKKMEDDPIWRTNT